MPDLTARLTEYERQLLRLMDHAQRMEARDLIAIRRRFSAFLKTARRILPTSVALNQATVASVLRSIAVELDALQRDLLGTMQSGISAKQELNRELMDLFGKTWLKNLVPFTGSSAGIFVAATEYSARLVGLNQGGLAARIQGQIDSALRLSVLGLDQGAMQSQAAISQALGAGKRWTFEAERIYRTEVNRFYSLMTQSSMDRLHSLTPISKRWYWSGVSREEHALIHGQTVAIKVKGKDGYFRVPRRGSEGRGGSAGYLPYPRAVRDRAGNVVPGDVTINCGCWHAPVPAAASEIAAPPRSDPGKRRKAS